MTTPDVSVVVAVYNTMPYLTECLASLVGQSIGRRRMEIVAVDDGSTDGSGAEIERFAVLHPGLFRVTHQANSGGPAAPSNRALEIATGRYVFFVGADDRLGPEALDRMVAMADRHGSDIVLGRMSAEGKRSVPHVVFQNTAASIPLVGSGALYAVSNTKLFRRTLIEQHHLRFDEDLPIGSDMPFTLEAYLRAGTISVLADYDYYVAVRRANNSNVTYRATWDLRLRVCGRAMDLLERIGAPADVRDEFATRLLRIDMARIFDERFLSLAPAERQACFKGSAEFVREYFGDRYEGLEGNLSVPDRLRYRWLLQGDSTALAELIRVDEAGEYPATHLEPPRAYSRYPGFRDPAAGIPDRVFEVSGPIIGRLERASRLIAFRWEEGDTGPAIAATVRVPVVGATDSATVRVAAGSFTGTNDRKYARILPADEAPPPALGILRREETPDGEATLVHAVLPLPLPGPRAGPLVLELRTGVEVAGLRYEIVIRPRGTPLPGEIRWTTVPGLRSEATATEKSRLRVTVAWPPRLRDRITNAIRRWRRGRRARE